MKVFIVFSAICLQFKWSHGTPVGVSSFAYQDSSGNRYGGTYHTPDGQLDHFYEPKDLQFQTPYDNSYQDHGNFFPDYFRNLQYLIQEAFESNLANQALALKAAQQAFDLTSNQAGYIPYLPFRSSDFGNFGNMFNSPNSAFAGGFASPGFTHQIAAISPPNPSNPNVNVFERFNEGSAIPGANFVSMKSTAYSSSSNINGKEISNRGSETVVNNNGKVTGYSVHS
nr:seroin 2 [Ephestia kuehniella]